MKKNYLFDTPTANRPWIDTDGDFDYDTAQKIPLTFWSGKNQTGTLKIFNEQDSLIWSNPIKAKLGINQFRWDLVNKRNTSLDPYFVHYDQFIEKGRYKLILEMEGDTVEGKLRVEDGIKPSAR